MCLKRRHTPTDMTEEELFGYIETIVYAEEESGFTVARLKEPKRAELVCLVGHMPAVQPGESVRCKGIWKHHPKHGRQFEVQKFEVHIPSDLLGIQKYLSSGMIKGIGAVYAERIVAAFGLETLKIIDENPSKLSTVDGIGKKRLTQIQQCWEEQRGIREVMIFLRTHGVSAAYAQKIFRRYGAESVQKVKDNPYALAKEIFGIGFKSADAIAKSLGIPNHSAIRIDSGIEHLLWELSTEGHVCYPEDLLIEEAAKLLQAPTELIASRINQLAAEQLIIKESHFIWVRALYLCEKGIEEELARLQGSSARLRAVDEARALVWVQDQLRIELAVQQKQALLAGMKEKVMVITGGPGTGKSTITKAILALSEKLTGQIILGAPTGRAAKRLSQITRKRAFTIHVLLEMDMKLRRFKRSRENPLPCDLIIIDEASMIDTQLMYHLLRAIPSHARLILIGDVDQLPSVGAGNVLQDIIRSRQVPVVELKEIFRQARGSQIITNAHLVNRGIFPELSSAGKGDFLYVECQTPEEISKEIVHLVATKLPKSHRFHRFDEIQVLTPMKKGIIGTENLNRELQKALNPSPSALVRMGRSFQVSDKVMQLRNNYQKEVYNGDVGRIVEINSAEQEIKVVFDAKSVVYDFSEIDELELAYAVSVHKYQGSESPCVVIPIHTSHFVLLNRNLFYTAITRGKKLVVVVGSKQAIALAVKNDEIKKRYTGLYLQQSLKK